MASSHPPDPPRGAASCELVFDSAGASNGSQAVVWIDNEEDEDCDDEVEEVAEEDDNRSRPFPSPTLIYRSHSVLHLATREAFSIRPRSADLVVGTAGGRDGADDHLLWRRQTSLRSSRTNTGQSNDTDEVITCLAHVGQPPETTTTTTKRTRSSSSAPPTRMMIAVGYSSGRVVAWVRHPRRTKGDEEIQKTSRVVEPPWTEHTVVDPSDASETKQGREWDPVTVLDGLWLDESRNSFVLLSGSCGGGTVLVCHYGSSPSSGAQERVVPTVRVLHHQVVTESPLASVRTILHQKDVLFLLGSAAPRHSKIHVYQCPQSDLVRAAAQHDTGTDGASTLENDGKTQIGIRSVRAAGALHGHQDWVTCFDWMHNVLASGSKDCRIRLWNFRVAAGAKGNVKQPGDDARSDIATTQRDLGDSDDENSTGPDDEDDDDDERGESRLDLVHGSDGVNSSQTSVLLDALLIGHEGAVTSVQWHPNPSSLFGGRDLILLSASMDRTILIWALEDDDGDGGGGGVWTPLPRLGVVGGILGGPLGSSLLGFCRAVWEPRDGRSIVGHAYGGALHVWSMEDSTEDEPATQHPTIGAQGPTQIAPIPLVRWRAMPGLTGHFDAVTDLCWEGNRGNYFLTVSKDQTCRLWAPMNTFQRGVKVPIWAEIARPQVHGYDLMSVSSLSTSTSPHRIVTAADEKELRVYDAPLLTTRALEGLCGAEATLDSHDTVTRALRAYIPSLGLTNKSSVTDKAEEELEGGEQDGSNNDSDAISRIPLERDLGVTSVWPENTKMFGHNSELYRVTSTIDAGDVPRTQDDPVLVASSTKARDSEAASIRLWDARHGKCLQILSYHKSTVVSMSFSSNGRYLASSGKDRRICLWEKQQDGFAIAWLKDSAHKRIIWSIHFNPSDPSVFASGSRDGSVKVWKVVPQPSCSVVLLHSFAPTSSITGKTLAVTSVSFAPVIRGSMGYLAVGTEPGMIEVWQVPTNDDGSPIAVLSIPVAMAHGGAVTKLDWRRSNDECAGLCLASSSADNSCKVFNVGLNNE